MGETIREDARAHGLEPVSLSTLIHQYVRVAIETAVHEELRAERSGRWRPCNAVVSTNSATLSEKRRSTRPPRSVTASIASSTLRVPMLLAPPTRPSSARPRLGAGRGAALILLLSLVASGQIKLRRIDGWQKIAAVVSQRSVAA